MRISRVLMTADGMGGVWTYALELARGLAEQGIEVGLATMGPHLSAYRRAEAGVVRNLRVFESSYLLEWMDDPWCDLETAGQWLLDLERQWQPDVVHLNGYVHGKLRWRAPQLVVGHSCVLSWWRAVNREEAPAEWRRYRNEVKRGIQAAVMVVAPSRAMLEELERYYGPLPPHCVIPNGRDPALFRTGNKQPFILSAGRLWDEAKNIAALDAISPRLIWPVYVAGDETHPNGRTVTESNLRLLGNLPADLLSVLMASASIYALPARYEPFGLSALEAALAGCALVLGDIPSLREVWGD
ncbi:MAG: glycosyltransferase family 4 protein, partial [Acidobacteria bacterium]|nr:glycosyltransferase family 4 protein [Acidobacteriota bacterium]